MSELDRITSVRIHPAIGIARVGSSQDGRYFGPEVPGRLPGPKARFKDKDGRIKRQAARFRAYGYDASGTVVAELTQANATIEWRVHLANRKAGWYEFQNAMDLGDLAKDAPFRNAGFAGDRKNLVNDPGPRAISGPNQGGPAYRFDTGSVAGMLVYLGELATDDSGHLLVLGGRGHSASFDGSQATTFANNDGWYDDTSDGTVRAAVTIADRTLEATPAMVAVTPPNYGQGLFGIVTMYEVLLDLFVREGMLPAPTEVDFWAHIYPILERIAQTSWVNEGFDMMFGTGSPSDFTTPALRDRLRDPSHAEQPFRKRIYKWFRDPAGIEENDVGLPPVYGDAFGDYEDNPKTGLAVTALQYAWLRDWSEGSFDPGADAPPVPPERLEDLALAERPHALDRANLEDCLGGPFHPGIELTWTLRVPALWDAPFRLKVAPEGQAVLMNYGAVLTPRVALDPINGPLSASAPGTLTWWMGVPWQTDEASCMSGYELGTYVSTPTFWAARVPNQVLPSRAYERLLESGLPLLQRAKHLTHRPRWLRFFGTVYLPRIRSMVQDWDKVGIVAERPGPTDAVELGLPTTVWAETEVLPALEDHDATWEMVLIAEGGATGADISERLARASVALPASEAARPAQRRKAHGRTTVARDEK